MKSRLNLYGDSLRPVKEKISLKLVVTSVVATTVGMAALGLIVGMVQNNQSQQLQQLSGSVKSSQQQIEQLQQTLAKREPSPTLVRRQSELEQSVAQKQKLLAFIQNEQKKTSVRFSPVFDYLADIDQQGLWLKSFSLALGESQFTGVVTQPDLLPLWLNLLSKNEFFKGQSFSQFEVAEQKDGAELEFVVRAKMLETPTSESAASVAKAKEAP